MCRIAAYVGPPVPLSHMLSDLPRALQVQAYQPKEMQRGHVNVDGTGVVWFDDTPGADGSVDNRPLRYRTQLPPWGDQTLVELAGRISSGIILQTVRAATPGVPQGQPFVHPFVVHGLAGTHNGWMDGFRRHVARPLLARLSDDAFAHLDGMSDANVLFLLAVDAYRQGADLLDAARQATDTAAHVCAAHGQEATLTLFLADHTGIAVVNAATGRPAHSLYSHKADGCQMLASEPLDPALDWRPVPRGEGVLLAFGG